MSFKVPICAYILYRKTRYRCSKQQKNMLVAHMVSVGDLSSSSALKSPKAQEALSASWEALAAKLAEVGPAKSVEQWKIVSNTSFYAITKP